MTALAAIGKWCLEYWYVLAIVAVIALLAGWGATMRGERDAARVELAKTKTEFAEYRETQAESAALAAKASLLQTIADQKRAEEANAENEKLKLDLADATKRLRDAANISGGSVSPAPAGSKCPDGQICFDKAEYQRTDGKFVAGARGLADEGTEVTTDIDTAQRWAKGRK